MIRPPPCKVERIESRPVRRRRSNRGDALETLDTLLALEREFWKAAGNPGHYELRFADDGLMAFDVGVMGKPAVLAAVKDSASWADFTIDDLRTTQTSDDVVALTYTTAARTAGADAVHRAVISSV